MFISLMGAGNEAERTLWTSGAARQGVDGRSRARREGAPARFGQSQAAEVSPGATITGFFAR